MTPKQKALELVGKMCLNDCTDKNIKLSKQFALIAVDEIIEEYGTYFKVNVDDKCISYWQEVKREIENL
jgi:hypothetical protein